jgi:NAD(P)-dependent dehydrogenase (short-subunit alcohol dehydrogenase family)
MGHILITGCSRGIGLAAALELARAGHNVEATMRDPARSPELAGIAAREGLPLTVRTMDVDSDESVRGCFAAVYESAGALDALVNNAGVERHAPIEELPLEEIRAVMETNYFGAIRCMQAVIPSMRERGSGCIVNVTSVAGRIASSPLGAYAASKHALEALSEALAQEMKPFGVRVAIVEPGIIDTRMAHAIENPTPTRYRQVQRFAHMFEASLSTPVPPTVVAAAIREVIESGTWKLRHPTGPDAAPFLAWRASTSDEKWVEFHALPDDEWYARFEAEFGKDVRPKRQAKAASPATSAGSLRSARRGDAARAGAS